MSYMGVHQILDCPELRKLITRYLRAGDIKVCVVVCKAWHGYFQGEVWKTLNLTEHRQQLWVSDEVVNAAAWFDSIRKNARWVRYLYYSYRLRPPQGLCDLLVETLRSLVYIEVLAKNEQEWAKFQQLILLNPAIRYIEVGVAHDHRDPYLLPIDLRLHSVITPMSTLLCSLVITTTTTVDQLLQILSVCPTLEELTVGHEFDHSRLVSHRPQQPEAPEAMVTKVADTDDDGTPPTAFSLKRLTVNSSSYDPALVNLMERCPALMHLGLNDLSDDVLIPLCNVLRSGCLPRLGSIMLISNARDSSRQLPLIIAIPPQQLQMADIWTNNALLYPTLVERHHQTLVSIQGCTVTGSDFRTVTPFFSRCRRLQKLNVHFIGEGELQVDIRYLLRVPWVCSEIEVLDMPIILDRECTEAVLLDIGLSEKAVKDPEKRSKWEQIEAVFMERLGQLVHLREIDLRDCNGARIYHFAHSGLSWSLEGGLRCLIGLSRLQQLHIGSQLCQLGVEELWFMKTNWPRLRILGYASEEYTVHRGWLREHWPTLVVKEMLPKDVVV